MNEQRLIPDPSSRPWPKPIEYVYVAWLLLAIFGPMVLLFWVLADDPTSIGSVLMVLGFMGAMGALIAGATTWTAHKSEVSVADVTRAVRAAAPHRLRRDYLGRR